MIDPRTTDAPCGSGPREDLRLRNEAPRDPRAEQRLELGLDASQLARIEFAAFDPGAIVGGW